MLAAKCHGAKCSGTKLKLFLVEQFEIKIQITCTHSPVKNYKTELHLFQAHSSFLLHAIINALTKSSTNMIITNEVLFKIRFERIN